MVKLIYKRLDGTERIEEIEKPTLQRALFEAKKIQYSITGQVIKIVDGEKEYKFDEIAKTW